MNPSTAFDLGSVIGFVLAIAIVTIVFGLRYFHRRLKNHKS